MKWRVCYVCWFGKTATWDQVFERLPEAIKDIEIAVVNSSRNSNKLDYSKHERDGLRVIAIGGLALSRGLTLEGLCVSYFYRNTATIFFQKSKTIETAKLMLLVNCTLIFLNKMD